MVYCARCGTKNEEGQEFCSKCEGPLYPEKRRRDTCFGAPRERIEGECFGIPHGPAIVGLIFGAVIILIGLAMVLGQDIGRFIGPLVTIVFGLLIVVGAMYVIRRTRQ